MSLVFHPLEEESSSDSMRLKCDARPCPIAKNTKGSDPYITQNQWLRRVHHFFQIGDGPHLPLVGKCGPSPGLVLPRAMSNRRPGPFLAVTVKKVSQPALQSRTNSLTIQQSLEDSEHEQ